jgi:hypothetical protein
MASSRPACTTQFQASLTNIATPCLESKNKTRQKQIDLQAKINK